MSNRVNDQTESLPLFRVIRSTYLFGLGMAATLPGVISEFLTEAENTINRLAEHGEIVLERRELEE